MPDLHLFVYAGTIALFMLGALAVLLLSLLVFGGIAVVHSIKQARRPKRPGSKTRGPGTPARPRHARGNIWTA